jgi:aldose 1-epimerase
LDPAARIEPFGTTDAGEAVDAVVLTNAAGMQVRILTLGATIQSVIVPDREGNMADVALGYPTAEGYCADPHYFGATIGRVANRIAGGRFAIDGQAAQVSCNDGANSLHGGGEGFDKRCWSLVETRGGDRPGVTLRLVSPDGDQGYPGTLTVTAEFVIESDNRLTINYQAMTDRATVVNLTNHAYWNLQGEGSPGSALGHLLEIPAEAFLATDAGSIPTGEFAPVRGSPFDFRSARPISDGNDARHPQIEVGHGYDHNWVLQPAPGLRLAARLHDPKSGRVLEVRTDKPGVQFYSGNFLGGFLAGKSGRPYHPGDGVAIEPQDFPDSPNHPEFASIRLDPGQTYCHQIEFAFSAV